MEYSQANTIKQKVVTDYNSLDNELKEQLKLVYPDGYADYLIQYTNNKGKRISALRFETLEKVYLLRMSEKMAIKIMDEDDDFDEDYNLKEDVQEELSEKHSDIEYLADNEDIDSY